MSSLAPSTSAPKSSLVDLEDLKQDHLKYKELTTQEKLKQALLNPEDEIPEEEAILYINNIPYGTKGNISTIIGKAKSKKSMFLSGWVAAVLGGRSFTGFRTEIEDQEIGGIYFDTEQSEKHCQLQYRRIEKLLGRRPEAGFSYYMLRQYGPSERLKMIEQAIYNASDLSFIVIDGIADLLSKGVNDEEEAIHITNLLMKWSMERNIHIITVLHQNKGDSNAKGHIGSQLVQKSETVISIERDTNEKDVSIVNAPFSRGMEIEQIYFSVDEHGIPFIVENFKTGMEKAKSKNPFDYEEEVNRKIIKEVFNNNIELSYSALNDTIRFVLAKYSISIGERKCRDWITYLKEQNMIIQEGNSKPYKLNNSWQRAGVRHP